MRDPDQRSGRGQARVAAGPWEVLHLGNVTRDEVMLTLRREGCGHDFASASAGRSHAFLITLAAMARTQTAAERSQRPSRCGRRCSKRSEELGEGDEAGGASPREEGVMALVLDDATRASVPSYLYDSPAAEISYLNATEQPAPYGGERCFPRAAPPPQSRLPGAAQRHRCCRPGRPR